MHRRHLLTSIAAALAAPMGGAVAQNGTPEDWQRRAAAMREEARANFPYEILQVPGQDALQERERLKADGRGYPVIVGSDEDLERILEAFGSTYWLDQPAPTVAATLTQAGALSHPDSLVQLHQGQREAFYAANPDFMAGQEAFEQRVRAEIEAQGLHVEFDGGRPIITGDWPSQAPSSPGLSVATNLLSGRPLERVNVVLLPTDDPTAAPAYLRWGGWNECPPPEYHVAAFRSWRDRYGAEIVGMSGDVLNLRVTSRPSTRDEALMLAREQYDYCVDIVDQGVGTLTNLAAGLMADDWWFFWWD